MWLIALGACIVRPTTVLEEETGIDYKNPETGGEDSLPTGDSAACAEPRDADDDLYDAASAGGTDCDDADPGVTACADTGTAPDDCVPTGAESCNGLDDDCDGSVDDAWIAGAAGASTVAAGLLLADDAPAVVLGFPSSSTGEAGAIELRDASGALVLRLVGESWAFGSVLAAGRDVDGDGHEDLLVADPYATVDGVANRGRVWLFTGPLDEDLALDDAAWSYEGGELDGQPAQIALAPDLSGDGLADILVGHYRHVLVYADPAGGSVADAWASVELNTGGGAWAFATSADEDGDGLPELRLGMPSYDGGTGLVATLRSAGLAGSHTSADSLYSDPAWPGLGAALAEVDGVLWALAGETPLRLDDGSSLALSASMLVAGGDLDGDGAGDLLLSDGVQAFDDEGVPLQAAVVFSDNRLAAAGDLDGDGLPDPRVATASAAGALVGALAYDAACDGDGDGVSAAAGDCDDADLAVSPEALERCDGLDNDCDGATDLAVPTAYDLSPSLFTSLGDADGDGLDDQFVVVDGLPGSFVGGAPHASFAFAGGAPAGDREGDGLAELWLFGEDGHVLVRASAVDTEDLLDGVRILDGTQLQRAAAGGSAGDLDGDGLEDTWLHATDPLGYPWLAVWSGEVPESSLDEAPRAIQLPTGWASFVVGAAGPGRHADVDGDGRDDLVLASASSYYGFGRVNLLAGGWEGTLVVDEDSLLAVYGDPDEALGSFVSLPGDLDGDGFADGWIGAVDGARSLRGGSCPGFDGRVEGPLSAITALDSDGDGSRETWTADGTSLWRDGVHVAEGSGLVSTPDADGDGLDEAWWLDGGLWRLAPSCD